MNEFQIEEGNFVVVPNEIIRKDINPVTGKRASALAIGVYTVLLDLPPDWDYSVQGLLKIMEIGKRALDGSLKELEQLGYLERKQERNDDNTFGKMKYFVYRVKKSPLYHFSVNGHLRKRVEPLAENVQQVSTKGSKYLNKVSTKGSKGEIDDNNVINGDQEIKNTKTIITLPLLEKIYIDNNFKKFNLQKFWNYYKMNDFKFNNGKDIKPSMIPKLMENWEVSEWDNKQSVNSKETNKPDWLDEYLDEFAQMED